MTLDHIVLRSPHRAAILAELTSRFALRVLDGYKTDSGIQSTGVRFRNGPFLDVFDWSTHKPPFKPILALEGDIAKAQSVATRFGWSAHIHHRNDVLRQQRPPWSTLSFRLGQGLISSVFVIEYEEAPEAWDVKWYRGPLYNRRDEPDGSFELDKVVIRVAGISNAVSQLEALTGSAILPFELCPAGELREGVESIRIRGLDGSISNWHPSTFDHLPKVGK